MKDKLNKHLVSNVKIEIIDKNTNKVLKVVKDANTLASYGASDFMSYFDAGINRGVVQYVGLYDNIPSRIKYLTGSWGTRESGAGYFRNTIQASDSSTDTYVVYHVSLNNVIPGDDLNQNVVKYTPTSPVTKGSDQILRITWTIQWSYG